MDVSENHLTDLSPLNYLTHLLWLKADSNRLRSAQLNELPYLQIASFAYNQITDTEGISHPRLGSLDLKGGSLEWATQAFFLPSLGSMEVDHAVLSCATQQFAFVHSFRRSLRFIMAVLCAGDIVVNKESPYSHVAYILDGGDIKNTIKSVSKFIQ